MTSTSQSLDFSVSSPGWCHGLADRVLTGHRLERPEALAILRSADQLTLPIGLRLFVQSDYAAKWGNLAAASLIGALPIVVTFLVAQKQIISGLAQGAVKG